MYRGPIRPQDYGLAQKGAGHVVLFIDPNFLLTSWNIICVYFHVSTPVTGSQLSGHCSVLAGLFSPLMPS